METKFNYLSSSFIIHYLLGPNKVSIKVIFGNSVSGFWAILQHGDEGYTCYERTTVLSFLMSLNTYNKIFIQKRVELSDV